MNPAMLTLLAARAAPAGGFSPDSIPGLDMWLKADSLSLADGAPVATWADSSGAGNHATQGTPGNQPSYRAVAGNGYPAVDFTATSVLASACPMGGPAQTVFALAYSDATSARRTLISCNVNGGLQARLEASHLPQVLKAGESVLATGAAVTVPSRNRWVLRWDDAADQVLLRVSQAETVGASTTSLLATTCLIGARTTAVNDPWRGMIAEVLHYSAALSPTDILAVEGYLATKYGI